MDSGSSSDELPDLQGLEELTNYSIRMAVFDDTNRLCVFSEPLVAQTGNLHVLGHILSSHQLITCSYIYQLAYYWAIF